MSNKEYVALNDCPMGVLVTLGVTLGVTVVDGVVDLEGEFVGESDPLVVTVPVFDTDDPADGVCVADGILDGVTVGEIVRVPLKVGEFVRDVVPDVD